MYRGTQAETGYGIIIQTLEKSDMEYMQKNSIPFVGLDRAPSEDCSVIRSQYYEGAQLAVKHLLEIGCKKIAHIHGPQEIAKARSGESRILNRGAILLLLYLNWPKKILGLI